MKFFDACVINEWYTATEAVKIVNAIRTVVSGTTETAIFRLSTDPKDNYLFDLAIQNGCSFIVSDDRLLRATPLKPVPVKTTAWFIKHYPPF